MGILFVIAFYVAMPFLLIFMLWFFKWVWIVFGLARGDSEAIHIIKGNTCDRKPKTWGERFEELLLPPDQQPRPPHDPDTFPWKRNNRNRRY